MGGTQALHYNHTVGGKVVIIQFIPGAGPPKLNELGTTGALNLYPPCFSIILDSRREKIKFFSVTNCFCKISYSQSTKSSNVKNTSRDPQKSVLYNCILKEECSIK